VKPTWISFVLASHLDELALAHGCCDGQSRAQRSSAVVASPSQSGDSTRRLSNSMKDSVLLFSFPSPPPSASSSLPAPCPGYKLTDQRSDFLARFAVQLIFLSRSRFYDFEKPVGQEQGRAVYASDYGFTSDRVSELDAASRHGNWTHATFGLSDFMNPSSVFIRRTNGTGGGNSKPSSDLPALASTPDSSSLPSDSSLSAQPQDVDSLVGSERRHHVQLTTLSRPPDPLLLNPHRERLFQRFQEEDSTSSDTLTPPLPLGTSPPPARLFATSPSPTRVSVGNVLHDMRASQ
jgi:hypothetical protein